MTLFIGIDLSPKGTGCVVFNDNKLVDFLFFTEVKKWDKLITYRYRRVLDKVEKGNENQRIDRLVNVRNHIGKFILPYVPDDVYFCLEDYTYQNSGSVYQIGEMGGVVRALLYELCEPIRTHDPKSVKLFWTGRGDSTKAEMIAVLLEKLDSEELIIDNKDFDFIIKDYTKNYYHKNPSKPTNHPLEGLTDAIALSQIVRTEISFRRGDFLLSDQPEHVIRVFNRVTKSIPTCLIDRPFLKLDK